jgi:lipopolysaccharide/colanic/teichoic acid biosynthesis glycosyltransferase
VSRQTERAALLISDAAGLALAFALCWTAATRAGWLSADTLAVGPVAASGVLLGFWLVLFLFAGLYQERFASSRFDEFVSIVRTTTFGALVLFFGPILEATGAGAARLSVAAYWGAVIGFVGLGRLVVREVQKRRLLAGMGRHRALVVGWSERVEEVFQEVQRYPQAGLELVGAVRLVPEVEPVLVLPGGQAPPAVVLTGGDGAGTIGMGSGGDGQPVGLGARHAIKELPALINRLGVQDVLIALGPDDHAYLDEVLRVCDGLSAPGGRPLALKLVPDFYAAVGGMARTEHMYGLPLIEVLPEPIAVWERHTKRLVDLVVSAAVLVLGLPAWLLVGLAVRMTSTGPAIYRQVRTGQHGEPFTIYKFRTMRDKAEQTTGPVWAQAGDARVTPLGHWLRRLRIDEVPQLWNVLKGEMSLVGPRPERPYFVRRLSADIPLYSRRHRVQPGVTGLAQVKWGYGGTTEEVRQKLKYDLLYIEHMSLGLDLRILMQTIRIALSGKGI